MNKVPNFSFQQALEVATQDQSKAVEILQFLNTKEHQLLSHLKLQASIEGDSVLEGKIELQNENASDMAHNMAQSDLSLSFAGTVNKTSKET